MHFITFPVASTNIFPLSNSAQGGQLVTEFNLKSRDMVATNPDIHYAVGPSFIHSLDDFKVSLLKDSDIAEYATDRTYVVGDYCIYNKDTYVCITAVTEPEAFDPEKWEKTTASISTSIIQVGPGRAVVNGHYVETFAPMQIDLNLANAELKRQSQPELYGNLAIGIKTYFSTESTMAGAMLVENTDNMYVGVQLVITLADEFTVPGDYGCREESEQGNAVADIKLAEFTYNNGAITEASIVPNANATRYIDSRRIYDFSSLLDDKYVSSDNLVGKKFYTYSGWSGWCDSTGSLMVWDEHPEQQRSALTPAEIATVKSLGTEANFRADPTSGLVTFVVPHKQQDYDVSTNVGTEENPLYNYYSPCVYPFPVADYNKGTPGTVSAAYTEQIKSIAATLEKYKNFSNGKQLGFINSLYLDSEGNPNFTFPKNTRDFDIGDYYIVREDYTISGEDGSAPSTMYFVLPGGVESITFGGTTQPHGVRLGSAGYWTTGTPTAESPTTEELQDIFNYTTYKGNVGIDYFELRYRASDDVPYISYYYTVASTGEPTWSDAVLLTGGLPLATEDQIGGFYNASTESTYEDAGYVYLDDTGHLKLLDYELLRSGALAYQLGSHHAVSDNSTIDYIQSDLDEYVNDRVAFFSSNTYKTSGTDDTESTTLSPTCPMIHVYIPLPYDEEGTINIYDIDSRFGTGVYLHFTTDEDTQQSYSGLIINIVDCEKVRIDPSVTLLGNNGPVINVIRSCLYYDASVIDYIRTCDTNETRETMFPDYGNFNGFESLTLWYSRFTTSDPDLIVNGMEVSQPNVSMITEDVDFWDATVANDNHYSYALRSITLSGNGEMIGCSLYVSNNSSQKDLPGDVNASTRVIIGGDFELPDGAKLIYPRSSITSPLSVTGTFTTAYLTDDKSKWITTETSFTAKTGKYSPSTGVSNGSIAFNSITYYVSSAYTNMKETISGWEPDAYHIFYGGTTY